MAVEVDVTGTMARATTAAGNGQKQLLVDSLEVSSIDQVDLVLVLLGIEGAVTAFQLEIITGMSTATEDGWVSAGTFTAGTTVFAPEKVNFPRLLKYIRWRVITITGGTAVTFSIRGMGRDN